MTIQDQVNDFISSGIIFTAFDVTTELRNSGIRISHDSVRKEVHQLFKSGSMGNYIRSQITAGAWSAAAFHPSHLSTADVEAKYNPAAPAAATVGTAVSSAAVITETICPSDSDGRVFIPQNYLDKLNITRGGTAGFTNAAGTLEITKGGSDITRQARGHMRVNPRSLTKAGLKIEPTYRVRLFPSMVTVTNV